MHLDLLRPGAIYTVGLNYRVEGEPDEAGPDRPMIYGKAASSFTTDGATLSWDRTLTANVDAECELGVVIGRDAWRVDAADAFDHISGYTIVNDVSSRDPWLDGDQWLVGKSMPGFCPAGPRLVPGRTHLADAVLGRGDRRVPQPPSRAPPRRSDRDRDPGPPDLSARARPSSRVR
jgi:2-keto-4-pentenoate hydratase/2-oxohepta-3-ene-1,7-dioic acid hydratase in catechol pathway